MLNKTVFIMYPVVNINRAQKFYKKHLGLSPSKISTGGAWVEYNLPEGGCFALTTLAENVNPLQLKSDDVTFKMGIFHSPIYKMAVIIDSEGNSVTLH